VREEGEKMKKAWLSGPSSGRKESGRHQAQKSVKKEKLILNGD